jgi:hypothetical protein
MTWLLFILVIDHNGQHVAYGGKPVAQVADRPICVLLGASASAVLRQDAAQRGLVQTFTFSCVPGAGA